MNIKNYTSSVPAEKSMSLIEALLVKAGARTVSKFYEGEKVKGFLFQIPVNGIPLTFKLPSNPEAVYKAMLNEYDRPDRVNKNCYRNKPNARRGSFCMNGCISKSQ